MKLAQWKYFEQLFLKGTIQEDTMGHTSREENGIVIFDLEGKIMGTQHDNYLILDKVYDYIKEDKINIVLDFSKVDWINSRGIGICITAVTALRNRNGDLKLACLNDKVESLLKKMRMFKIFEAYKSVEEAIKSFG
jgi:anti-sigma B factor antagonist